MVMRTALILALALLAGGDRSNGPAGAPGAIASPTATAPSATDAAAAFARGATSVSGRVIRQVPSGVVVESAGTEVEVSLGSVADVWKETSVPASALEVGDDLFVDGAAGAPFVATHVYANIGHIDGVIRSIDQTGMLVDVHLRGGGSAATRIEFSPSIEYGGPAARAQLTRADLVVGRTISAVTYRPNLGPLRATRIW